MRSYEEIAELPTTKTGDTAKALFVELLSMSDWRKYSSTLMDKSQLYQLINRFLRAHARIPGALTEETMGTVPVDVFRFKNTDNGLVTEGATFLNGAVLTLHVPSAEDVLLLFVRDEDAKYWKYPDKGFQL